MAGRLDSGNSLYGSDQAFNQYKQSYAAQGVGYEQGYPQQQQPYSQPAFPQPGYPQDAPYSQPAATAFPPQPALSQPAYAENPPVTQDYNQGYAHREGLAPSGAAPSVRTPKLSFLKSRWPGAFMAVTGLQLVVCLACEA